MKSNHGTYIRDGSSEHDAHIWNKIGLLRQKKIGFDDSVDVTKCLRQIKIADLLHMCAQSATILI